ncbi:MAG: carbohydrate kinase family protein [Candidatus Woesearchaeota archaeon]
MYDVVAFGSATVDMFVDTYDRKHISKMQKKMDYEHMIAYPIGDKIIINNLDISIGGGGTNTAVTFKRFDLSTAYCGCLGNDYYGIVIKDFLERENIVFLGHTARERTGTSVILDSIKHDRTILTYKGANNKLSYTKLDKNALSAKLFYFSSLIEGSFETQLKLFSFAKKNGIVVAFNPSSYQSEQGKKLWSSLAYVDYLILNKEEAQLLLVNETPHVKELLEGLFAKLKKKNGVVIITDGKEGAFAFDGTIFYKVPPRDIEVVESTGAGDAFASGFVASYLKSKDMEFSLKMGAANAESVITHSGAKEKILTRKEAELLASKVEVVRI